MSGILNIGTRALLANQAALQVAGNNIANVNTPAIRGSPWYFKTLLANSLAAGTTAKAWKSPRFSVTTASF